ncbi:MAG: hypothetical protein ABWZ25_16010 [Chitinophagaceae bacterium]
MKLNLLFGSVLLVTVSSCSTAYRTGQTPDDVYYSPGKAQDEYVKATKEDRAEEGDDPDDYETYAENRYLRMRVANRTQWSVLDDYYFYSPLSYSYYGGAFALGYGWNNPWSSYHMWNNFYNPYGGYYGGGYYGGGYYGGGYHGGGYYGGGYYGGGLVTRYRTPSRPVSFNPSSYTNGNRPRGNSNSGRSNGSNYYNGSRYNNSNGNSYGGGSRPSNSGRNNNNSSYEPSRNNNTPSRSYNPSSGNQSSGSNSGRSSGGSSTPPARPPR